MSAAPKQGWQPNWVTFATLNTLRFPFNPVTDDQWRRWCREGKVPCCKFPDGWRVDLASFDRMFSVAVEYPADETDPDFAFVASLSEKLGVSS